MKCAQPGCTGTVVDGYCDVCGLAPAAAAGAGPTGSGPVSAVPGDGHSAVIGQSGSTRLGQVPLGSARSSGASRPTRRLTATTQTSRLGAGLTQVPSVPDTDPRQALMDPPTVAEDKRFCSVCGAPVGRSREGAPGRSKGFCPKCRTPFDFDPKLQPGALVGGQYEVVGGLAHGGMGWIYLANDRNVNDRWVVLKGLLNSGDPDAARAAVAEKQYLAEVEHPLIVEIYNFVTAADGASYIVMEYVGGRSLNILLKDRMKATGRFSPIPVDQAIAYIVEILPAFAYLHLLGLLYCDFKPANVIQVGDGLKLIDLGGVRRVDDDQSPIYGTVGFQAPEVAKEGTSIASDLYTIARTLAVLIFEFKGYQSAFETTLPPPTDVPVFAQHDSLYRWLLKGTAPQPEDRFQTADEMRDQLLGVLREVTAATTGASVTRSTPSRLFDTPAVADDRLDWSDLPMVAVDPLDPMASWLVSVTAENPADRLQALSSAPERTVGVAMASGYAAMAAGQLQQASTISDAMLGNDPWEWRGVWLHGLVALHAGDFAGAISAFNSVYGQLPGELAPKLALARSCELGGEPDVAAQLYAQCAKTDAAYIAPAQFGLARIAAAAGRRDEALAAFDHIPATSRAYGDARRQRALLLASTEGSSDPLHDLAAAAGELDQAALDPAGRVALRIKILASALDHVRDHGAAPHLLIAGSRATSPSLRSGLEQAYRDAARLADNPAERTHLVDQANSIRVRSLT
ncbi:MAG: tetratricopeptide repeat protein [Ilumatobacteraceae bacterium]